MAANNKFLIVHLSDIHISEASDSILARANQLSKSIFSQIHQVHKVVIIASGDIAWSGSSGQYALAKEFIENIKAILVDEKADLVIDVVVCPGNHDVDFTQNNDIRSVVLEKIRNEGAENISSSLIECATSLQQDFFDFRNQVTTVDLELDNKLVWGHKIEVGDRVVGIRCLNVAWMSEKREIQGALHFPVSMIRPFDYGQKKGINITVLHHPFNWYSQSTYHAFKNAVRHESHFVITGHEHHQNIGENQDMHSSPSIYIEGGVLYETADRGATSTFNTILVDLNDDGYVSSFYGWNGTTYLQSVDESEWGTFRPLPSKGGPRYRLVEKFESELNDPGAKFSHPAKKEIGMTDIFVWPDLHFLDDVTPVKRQQSASLLEMISNISSAGAFIKGGDRRGKTTLLKQGFRSYHQRGFLPVYIKASWLQKQHIREPLKAVNFALERQYVRESHQGFHQESKEKKILLLDDLQQATLTPSQLSDCLEGVFKFFAAIVVTAKDSPEYLDLTSVDKVAALRGFTQYEIREFGHKKRYELIRRWMSIGDGIDADSREWMATVDRMEKDLTATVGRQLVPAVPIFLLTLLQSGEAHRTADLQNSAFGHYYRYLIASSLESSGIQKEQWAEIFNYCSNLAWVIFSSSASSISEIQITEFSTNYAKEFTPIAPGRRLRDLEGAGIISVSDGNYMFRYPYIYYMFLGQYIADHVDDNEVNRVIGNLCDDLHLKDNSSILLFIAHHTKRSVIYERLCASLLECFSEHSMFDFERDVQAINLLIDKAPDVLFDDAEGRDRRAEAREKQDELEDTFTADSDQSQTVGVAAAVTRLFRGMEILGQFVKNHYGTIRNPVKNELIDTIIQGALRGLTGFSESLMSHNEILANAIERVISEKSRDIDDYKRKQLARKVVFDLVGVIAFAFVQKASSCVGSEYLKQNISNVTSEKNDLSYRLVEMSHQLDLPEAIPFEKIKQLSKDLDGNIFGQTLLRSLALRHLHMFKVPYKEKQRLCSELNIELSNQMAIEYVNRTR